MTFKAVECGPIVCTFLRARACVCMCVCVCLCVCLRACGVWVCVCVCMCGERVFKCMRARVRVCVSMGPSMTPATYTSLHILVYIYIAPPHRLFCFVSIQAFYAVRGALAKHGVILTGCASNI